MANLTTKQRKVLPGDVFGIPSERKFPMEDKRHAANAKARASQMANEGIISNAMKSVVDLKADRVLDKGNGKRVKK